MLQPEMLGAFFGASLVLAAAPGPDNIFVLAQSALYGTGAGLVTTLGLLTGLCGHIALVALGLAALLQSSPAAFTALKFAGAAYLLYLAWGALRSGTGIARSESPLFPGYGALYLRGVIMNLTNPKVTLFFLAFLPQFVRPDLGSASLQIVILGGLFQAATFLVFGAVALLGSRLATCCAGSARGRLFLNRAAACIFICLALLLAFSPVD